jgi:hypothetical protein
MVVVTGRGAHVYMQASCALPCDVIAARIIAAASTMHAFTMTGASLSSWGLAMLAHIIPALVVYKWVMLCMPQVMGKSKVLVKVHPEGKYVVDIDKEIDIAELTPGEQGGKKNEEGRRDEDECAAVPAIAVTDRCSVGGQQLLPARLRMHGAAGSQAKLVVCLGRQGRQSSRQVVRRPGVKAGARGSDAYLCFECLWRQQV